MKSDRRQVWYLARHLKQLSDDLAAWGFAEAALLVGAAAISIGDQTVRAGVPTEAGPEAIESTQTHRNGVRHG